MHENIDTLDISVHDVPVVKILQSTKNLPSVRSSFLEDKVILLVN